MADEKYVETGFESTYGTPASTMVAALVTDFSDNIDRSLVVEYEIGSRTPTVYAGAYKLTGNMGGTLRPVQIGPIIGSVFGDTTPAYALGAPQGITIEYGVEAGGSNEVRRYTGVGVTKFNLSCRSGEFVRWDADWIAQDVDTTQSHAPLTYVGEDPLTFYKANVSVNAVSLTISEFTLSIDRKLNNDSREIDDNRLKSLSEGAGVGVTGTLTFTEEEYAEFVLVMFGTTATSMADKTNTIYDSNDLTIILTDTGDVVKTRIILDPVAYSSATQTISKRGEVQKKLNFTAVSTSANTTWALS